MNSIEHFLSLDKIKNLIQEAENLDPDRKVEFEIMHDARLLRESAGGAATSDHTGRDVIFLDPERTTEYIVAHELMHVILHRDGWPQMSGIFHERGPLAKNIADTVDNILDQYIFDPMLEHQGFDVQSPRNWYIAQFHKWPNKQHEEPGLILRDALHILEGLLYDKKDQRRRVIRAVKRHHPNALNLSRKLRLLIDPSNERTKSSNRRSMIDILKYIDEWLTEQLGYQVNLEERIGVTPLFTDEQMHKPTLETIEFFSYQTKIEGSPFWVGAFAQKSDHIRFRNVRIPGSQKEPLRLKKIREEAQRLNLQEFLESEKVLDLVYGSE